MPFLVVIIIAVVAASLLYLASRCCLAQIHSAGGQFAISVGSNNVHQQSDRQLYLANGRTSVSWIRGQADPIVKGPSQVTIERLGRGRARITIREGMFSRSCAEFRYM